MERHHQVHRLPAGGVRPAKTTTAGLYRPFVFGPVLYQEPPALIPGKSRRGGCQSPWHLRGLPAEGCKPHSSKEQCALLAPVWRREPVVQSASLRSRTGMAGRSRTILRTLFAAGLVLAAATAAAQSWPSRSITLVVPFPPGGGPGVFSRIVTKKLAPRVGQSGIVENRPGVGGLAGANAVAKSTDGIPFWWRPTPLLFRLTFS